MGQSSSHFNTAVNANCSICMKSGKMPNLVGRFFIINEKECKCNGCNTIFDKKDIYKQVHFDSKGCVSEII
jgi:hypothetical protein